jgi:hypothetical protein
VRVPDLRTAEQWVEAVGDVRDEHGAVAARALSLEEMTLRQLVILTRQMEDIQQTLGQPVVTTRLPREMLTAVQPTAVAPSRDDDEDDRERVCRTCLYGEMECTCER